MPHLKKFGVTPENLIYKFDLHGVRFIYLWSGKYDHNSPSLWDADRPKYAEQMKQLQLGQTNANPVARVPVKGFSALPSPRTPARKLVLDHARQSADVAHRRYLRSRRGTSPRRY